MPKLKYGIYSIDQREDSERSTCRQPYNATASNGTSVSNNRNTPKVVFKNRVRNISQKVVTLNLNDESNENDNAKSPLSIAGGSTVKSDAVLPGISTDLTDGPKSMQQLKEHTECDAKQTQGDALNQIKAMRRRHSRSVNVSASL